ncbi:type 1 glutamine amidotransferase [Actinomyces capricornis]|uniref:type 1 glutamine amidotransferase n=1 Tax=Actinomyces capricornis TaxID=2755559 RepID=UPI001CC5136C|nr:type 1 glutamine amidotransferase [Actinomyces capricornis]
MNERRAVDRPLITVIEPEAGAPLGRLGEWLFAEGAALRTVRPWQGQAIPALEGIGDGLIVLGGAMSAHDDPTHPWLEDLRALLRQVAGAQAPAIAICLGAQVAAEALGGATAVPSPHGAEGGVVDLELTPAALEDPLTAEAIAEAVRAAVRAGIPTRGGTRIPVIVSHDDVVTRVPDGAVLLASSHRAPIQAWRAGRLLALQHHPESTPERVAYWRARSALRHEGMPGAEAIAYSDMPAHAREAGERARRSAVEADPVIQAFGRRLARTFARQARAYSAARGGECAPGSSGHGAQRRGQAV